MHERLSERKAVAGKEGERKRQSPAALPFIASSCSLLAYRDAAADHRATHSHSLFLSLSLCLAPAHSAVTDIALDCAAAAVAVKMHFPHCNTRTHTEQYRQAYTYAVGYACCVVDVVIVDVVV